MNALSGGDTSPLQTKWVRLLASIPSDGWRWTLSLSTALSRSTSEMMPIPVPAATQAIIAW